ncbi:MAG TPA: PQQ-dependent sugar dehydrogenase [Chitinophagaceae bacterium]|nr:PQQ-dependent sugar dehydrogenase [Chitinophagaceae bacterium]
MINAAYKVGFILSLPVLFIFTCSSFNPQKNVTLSAIGGISLPAGFTATVLADSLGRARHLVVNSNGDIYVKLERLINGKGIMRLRDANKDGIAESVTGFGNYGGTGIAIKDGYLYASSNEDVFRYKINNNEVDTTSPEKIVTGLVNKRQHASKSIALDNAGNIYVNIGAPSNSCQEQDRAIGSKGQDPCPILETAGGVWQFKVNKLNQSYAEGIRYVTGIRNIVGLDWNNDVNELYAVQHGRDDLNRLYPDIYSIDESVELPAEELFLMKKGADFGWPYCYYDQFQNKKVNSPEYGGNKIKTDRCEDKDLPIYTFPGHWGPNALLFYTGNQFPEKYRNGAFIAWHGSWNRAPREQQGYFVTFLPFKNGKPSGDYEIFADGFAGENKTPQGANWRPCGLAQAPDGSLIISDDQKGRIWKVSYTGK